MNGDGTFGDATGANPTLNEATLNALGIDGPFTSANLRVQVSDGVNPAVTSAATTLTVNNVAPVGTFVRTGATTVGNLVTLNLVGVADPSAPDTAAGFTYRFDFGDGGGFGGFGASASAAATYYRVGTYTVRGEVRDQNGGFTAYSLGVTVTPGMIALAGDAANNVLVVTATGPAAGTFKLDNGPVTPFDNATKFSFTGGLGNDILSIVNSAGSLFAPTGGISYDGGGQPGDALEDLGGTSDSGSYRVGPGNGDGVLTHVLGATTQTITFTGLAPATDTVVAATFTVFGTNAANAITVDNGAVGRIRVSIDAFEPIELSNKTDIVIEGGLTAADPADVGDTVLVNVTQAITGLATLTVNAGTGDDAVSVQATPLGFTTTLNGGVGNDTFVIGAVANSLAGVLGAVTVNGDASTTGDLVTLLDGANAAATTYTVSATAVTRSGAATVTLGTVESVSLAGGTAANTYLVTGTPALTTTATAGAGNDTFNVQATTLGKVISLLGGLGSDTFNVSSNAPTNTGNFAGLQGNISLDSGNAAGGTDVLNVSGSGAASAESVLVKLGTTNELASTSFNILVAVGKVFGGGVNLSLGSGNDSVSVISTRAGEAVNVATNGGNDAVVFSNGVTLQGGTADGGLGTDTLDYSLYSTGVTIDLGAGTATGTAGATGFENATGGSGNDTLTGDGVANVLTGNDGNDAFVGRVGADTLSGGNGNDTFTWNNGDSSDTIDGGNNADTVIVNGNPAASNTFTVGAGAGGRVNFQRISMVAFTLDIGTVETLSVNGGTLADSFAVADLTATANLAQINLTGNAGDDTFTVLPTTVPVSIDGGAQAVADALTIDATGLAVTFDGTTGSVTVAGKAAVTYTAVETVTILNATAGVTVQGAAGNDVLTLSRAVNNLTFTLGGVSYLLVGAATGAGGFTFNGNAGNDKLVVDFAGGSPIPAGGITYAGGTQTLAPGDVLQLNNGTFTNLTFNYTSANDGSVVADGKTITYTGLEPVTTVTSTVVNVVINLPAAAQASLEDDATATDGVSQIRSLNATFELTSFPNPTGSLTVNAGGTNLVQLAALDSLFATPVLNFTGLATTDVFRLVASNVLPDAAALTVTNATFDVSTKAETIGSLAGSGALTFGANGTLTTGNATSTTYSGVLSGPPTASLVKVGAGTFTLSGSSPAYDGTIAANAGTLRVTANNGLGSATGATTVAAGANLTYDAVTYATAEPLNLNGGTVNAVTASTVTVGAVLLGATSTLNTAAAADTLTVTGNITQTAASGLVKNGAGLVTLNGSIGTYAGTTQVNAGTLQVNTILTASQVQLATTATLVGNGQSFGIAAASGSTVNPGVLGSPTPTTFFSGAAVSLAAGSTLVANLGNSALSGLSPSDRLMVAGTVTLGATLSTVAPPATASFGTQYVLIDNDGLDAVTGTFAGLPEGAYLSIGGVVFQISYVGGTGNDVVLTASPNVTINDVTLAEGNAGTTAFTFTLTLSGPSSQTVYVDFATADNTALIADGDYTAATGTVIFAPGEVSRTVTVNVTGDRKFEATETFFVNLTNPINVIITDAQGLGTITADDLAPTVAVTAPAPASEGNAGQTAFTFTVTLSNPSDANVTVNYSTANGSATTADGDYTAIASTALVFAPGEVSKTVTVLVTGDGKFETNETFDLVVTGSGGATATATILNDDLTPTASVASASAAEGAAITFTVTLSNPSSVNTVITFATTDGTATTADADYVAPVGGTLTILAGQTTGTFAVATTADTKFEADETFTVAISGPVITGGPATGTILNNDPVPSFTVSDATVVEGNAGTVSLVFTVTLSNAAGTAVSVNYDTAGVTATVGTDFLAASGTLTFAAGTATLTQTVTVVVLGDTIDEPNETLTLNLTGATGGTIADGQGLGTITDDDPTPTVSVTAPAATNEGAAGLTAFTFTVTLSNPSGTPVSVTYSTADGTGANAATTADGDYAAASGTLTFAPGEVSKTVTVYVVGDTKFEANETFGLVVLGSGGANATATILNDDALPTVSIGNATVSEGVAGQTTALTFTVTLTNPSGTAVTLNYATADGTGLGGATTADGDYAATSGALTFAPGEVSKTVTVLVNGDGKFETNETFTVNLSGVTGATPGVVIGTGTILNDDAAPAVGIDSVSRPEGLSGTTPFTFTVTLSNASSQAISVNFATANGTATLADGDYASNTGTLTFAPGETTKTVTVNVAGDAKFEATEAFTVTLSGLVGTASIAAGTGTGTIVNDDTLPTFSLNDVTLAEGSTVGGTTSFTFTVTLSNPSDQVVTVGYATADGSATTADSDYAAQAGSLTFAPGGALTQTVTVLVTQDLRFEGAETFALNLSGATNATVAGGQGVGTITNDDAVPTASVAAPAAANEGNAGLTPVTFTVTLSNPSSLSVTVNYATADGSATLADGDYINASGVVTFAPGETTKAVTVYVAGDLKTESNETFALTLTGAANATLGAATATATVTNDDAAPTASIGNASVAEGNAGTKTLTFTVTLSNPTDQAVTVNYVTADGTATAGSDYTAVAAGTLTIPAGQTTGTFAVTISGDTTFEADEAFAVTLNGVTNATIPGGTVTATGTILNDDTVPTIAVSDAAVAEGNAGTATLTFTVTLSNASSTPVTVNYATADGSATAADGDYLAASGSLTFAAGVTSQLVTVVVNGDLKFEGNETLTLNLSGAAGGVVADGTGVGTVTNDDAVPTVSVAAPAAANEGNVGLTPRTFTVTLSNPSSLTVTVSYATADGTATAVDGDYQPAGGVLTFAPGEVTKSVTVYAVGDLKAEPNEDFALTLTAPTNATVSTANASAVVLNDDAPPAVTIGDAAVNEGDAATATLTFTVTLSNPSSASITVNFATADGTATTADGDYLGTSGLLVFAPGQVTKTVTVLVNGDGTSEPNETLTVLLSGLTGGATLANGTGTGTVVNDDAPPVVSVGDAAVAEGDAGTATLSFAVTLSNPSSLPVTVLYATADGTATAGGDYTAGSGTVTFAPGEVSKTVTVAVTGDGTFEADETLTVGLSSPTNATLGRATGTGTVVNDDAQPTASVGAASVAEGDAGAAALTFTVTLSRPSFQTVQVAYATGDGTATAADGDYQPANGLVTFAPGETTKTVTVLVNGDRKAEPNETVRVSLSGASNATIAAGLGVGTVVNDDPVPTASVSDATVAEGSSGTTTLAFTVTLSNPSSSTVTVNYATADGTATAGSDYDAASGTLTFAPGEVTKTVAVTVRGDTLFEPNETLTLTLSGAANAGVARAQAVGTILNDAGDPALAVGNASVAEGNSGTTALSFAVTLSRASATPVTVSYRTVDGTAKAGSDYAALAPTTLTFAPGETTKTVTVAVNGDRTFEPTETLSLQLSGAAGAILVPGGGAGTVVNDDGSPTLAVGSGLGNTPRLLTYDGTTRTPQGALSGTEAAFTGGVRVAAGDINNDGVADTVTTVGPGGGSTVRVRDGKTGLELQNFLAFEQSFTGGAYVAVGDFNGDGFADIVVSADEGGGGRVRVLDGKSGGVLADFLGIEDLGFRGGARVAVGDLNGDGVPDLAVGAGFGGGPRVAAFDGASLRPGQAPVKLFADFFVFEASLRNGVFVAVGDINGDGFGELVFGGGPGGGPRVLAVSGVDLVRSGGRQMTPVANFFAGDPEGRGGVRLALKDFDGDGRADLVAGSGDGLGTKVTVYRGSTVTPSGTPAVLDQFDAFPGLNGGVYVG